MRAHVVIPEEVVKSVDELVGKRRRSRFFAEAVAEKMNRVKLARAARKAVGSLAKVEISGWETGKSAREWVRKSRLEDEKRLARTS